MTENIKELMEMFYISFRVVVTHTYVCIKIHQALPLRIIHFTVCILYFNKYLKKRKDKGNKESMEEYQE